MAIDRNRACYLLWGVALSAFASPVQAQTPAGTAPAAAGAPAAATTADEIDPDEIVVVGTAGAGTRRQDAAFAVTTVDQAAVQRLSPQSTADLLRVVPGVTVESSGGQNGANIFVRGFPSGGDAQFVTFQNEGVPIFPPPTLSFLENSQLIRFDETLERVEAVRGGTGALFSAGQPGLTINVVQQKGGDELHGVAKISYTDFGVIRGDGVLSGPLGENTTALIGGYYATGNGIRDPQFTAERGGQISGNIRHTFDRGQILVFGRYLDDRGQWLLPIPVVQNGSKITQYPGFDAGIGTLLGRETRRGVLNDGSRVDIADGRGARIGNVGFNVDYEIFDGVRLRDRFSWLGGKADTTGLVPGAISTAGEFAAGYTIAGQPTATIGTLSYANGDGVITDADSLPVVTAGTWTVRKDIDAQVNDFSAEWKSGGNTLTGGFYFAHTATQDVWNLGNNRLLTLEPNARVLNLTLADGRIASRDGFVGGSFFRVDADYDAYDYAFYLTDEWQLTEQLRVDGGIRWQKHTVDGTLRNLDAADLDGNPDTLYDNGNTVFAPGVRRIRYRGDDLAGTVGVNFDFSRQVGAFARYSHGNVFPFFDNLRDGLDQTQTVDSYELGIKATLPYLRIYGTFFHNDFDGLATTQLTNGAPIPSVGGARTNGVELEGVLTPFDGLQLGFAATYLDAKYRNFTSNGGLIDDSGNQVQRQPKWSFRIAPSYERDLTDHIKAAVFSSFYYTGNRFSDVENQQLLPKYIKWDLGAAVTIDKRLTLQVSADNLTDEIGLTEGNPRQIGTQGSGAILARPILGRSFTFSAAYRF